MRKLFSLLLILVLAMGIAGAKADVKMVKDLEQYPYYAYSDGIWSFNYSYITDDTKSGLMFCAYGDKNGTLRMPVFIQGACRGYYADSITIRVGGKLHTLMMKLDTNQFYIFQKTEPLFAAMREADEITVYTTSGSRSETVTISGSDYAPIKEYINALYESGVIGLSVKHEDSSLMSQFITYIVQ